MSDPKPDLSRLSKLATGMDLHEHLCLIYDTPEEQRMYDERTAQIARELLFVFAQAAK